MGKRKNAQNGGAESKAAEKKIEKLDLWFRFKLFEIEESHYFDSYLPLKF